MLELLANAISELDEPLALDLVKKTLDSDISPLDIVEECRAGLVAVGERYSRGEYFLGDLILSSEIFSQIMELIGPVVETAEKKPVIGKIVFGTIEGDIHDIGKNLVGSLLPLLWF